MALRRAYIGREFLHHFVVQDRAQKGSTSFPFFREDFSGFDL